MGNELIAPLKVWDRLRANRDNGGRPYWTEQSDGCWVWRSRASDGYGTMQWRDATGRNRSAKAHRMTFHFLRGAIPEGLEIDHLCRNRGCVNPWHLEPVTRLVNVARSPIHNGGKTHCPQGHPYDEANTYAAVSGARRCRVCTLKSNAAYKARVRVDK